MRRRGPGQDQGRLLRPTQSLAAALAAVALIAAGCTDGPSGARDTTVPSVTRPLQTFNQGGDITVAAEGEPGCMDWISTCAGSSWGIWTVETNTMPRAYDFTTNDVYKPSILLTGEADVQSSSEQVITYRLNPKAVWSDGQPITAHDFKYTWDQIAHGPNVLETTGYRNIVSVDDADPRTPVVTLAQPFADWKKLFGGAYGLLPSHLLEGHDRNAAMKDGYNWSGGPWALAPGGWTRTQSIKLVPNPNYWGKKPDLASVTFKVIPDAAAELQAFTAGEVLAAYPQAQPATASFRSVPGTSFGVVTGLDLEALWLNVGQAPFTTKAVRQAVAYSLDRAAIANLLFANLLPGVPPNQAFLTAANVKFYTQSFAKYRQDLTLTTQLMVGEGWGKGADGVWAKQLLKATFELKYPAESERAQLAAGMVAAQLKTAGFLATATPVASATLFGHDLAAGNFVAAIYPKDRRRYPGGAPGSVTAGSGGGGSGPVGIGMPGSDGLVDNDPGQCRLFCSANIPTAANLLAGANYSRVNDPSLDRTLVDLDTKLDENARIDLAGQVADSLAELVPAIPIAPVPDIVVVNTNKIGVEGGTFSHNLAYGPYAYLNGWYLK